MGMCCVGKSPREGDEECPDYPEGDPSASMHGGSFNPPSPTTWQRLKQADPSAFVSPCAAVGVSGGTAAFFKTEYRPPAPEGRSLTHWIGKDLGRAQDEVAFYETAELCRQADPTAWDVLRFMFEYGGVVSLDCTVGAEPPAPRRLVLMRNLFDGVGRFRMLDIKIGAVTAVGGWQGKSHLRAWRQVHMVDQHTNSASEGYRLEGFEGPPPGLASILRMEGKSKLLGAGKRAKRLTLQRLHGKDFFSHFVQVPCEVPAQDRLSKAEVAAHALRSAVRQLLDLVASLDAVPVPQQWIGSSVAVSFDVDEQVPRAQEPRRVGLSIFDWGRSELTTPEVWAQMPHAQQKERRKHWAEYKDGILRLAFEAARAYRNRYCPSARGWRKLRVHLFDYDQMQEPELIGSFDMPLKAGPAEDREVLSKDGEKVLGKGGKPTKVRVAVEGPLRMPKPSLLKERWVVKVVSVTKLPKMDVVGYCDPFVTVTLFDSEGDGPTLQTVVMENREAAHFMEQLEFHSASSEGRASAPIVPEHLRDKVDADISDWDLPKSLASDYDVKRSVEAFRNLFLQHDRQVAALQGALDEGALSPELFAEALAALKSSRGAAVPPSPRSQPLQQQQARGARRPSAPGSPRAAPSNGAARRRHPSESSQGSDGKQVPPVTFGDARRGDSPAAPQPEAAANGPPGGAPPAPAPAAAAPQPAPLRAAAPQPCSALAALQLGRAQGGSPRKGGLRRVLVLGSESEPIGIIFSVIGSDGIARGAGAGTVVLCGAIPGSPAERAGLGSVELRGRELSAIDGAPVEHSDDIGAAVALARQSGRQHVVVALGLVVCGSGWERAEAQAGAPVPADHPWAQSRTGAARCGSAESPDPGEPHAPLPAGSPAPMLLTPPSAAGGPARTWSRGRTDPTALLGPPRRKSAGWAEAADPQVWEAGETVMAVPPQAVAHPQTQQARRAAPQPPLRPARAQSGLGGTAPRPPRRRRAPSWSGEGGPAPQPRRLSAPGPVENDDGPAFRTSPHPLTRSAGSWEGSPSEGGQRSVFLV
eukprot:TRINITY_DN15192_c0_g1_i2.p1 TRINITY_DN15192_c0_g1~~TRINITY_DN15192_c0_g1_i2.p1  ORF type:complete len:1068 (+),score=259.85 TRINITY_DN15192_c0_g1_i2:92-3205(+)